LKFGLVAAQTQTHIYFFGVNELSFLSLSTSSLCLSTHCNYTVSSPDSSHTYLPPKKDVAAADANSDASIKGFDNKETKILAAAFLSQISHDKVRRE
jgi:hypothetical protein